MELGFRTEDSEDSEVSRGSDGSAVVLTAAALGLAGEIDPGTARVTDRNGRRNISTAQILEQGNRRNQNASQSRAISSSRGAIGIAGSESESRGRSKFAGSERVQTPGPGSEITRPEHSRQQNAMISAG